jgi:tetratricopeptide (TPR) repeat protein
VVQPKRKATGPKEDRGTGSLEPELRVPLRLAVSRGALGLETYAPLGLGPVSVERLDLALPGLKFPVDLSGGVKLFRHRRGRLEHMRLLLRLEEFRRYLDRRAAEALGGLLRPSSVWSIRGGIGVGLVGALGAVAFDVLWAPIDGDGRFVVSRARGADLGGPALGVVLSIVDTAVGRWMQRNGRVVTLKGLGGVVARGVLPDVGARAPSAVGLRCSSLEAAGDDVSVELDRTFPPPALAPDAVRALELATLARDADDALVRGELDAARAHYVALLDRAPRHPEICRIVAEIDSHAPGRAEGALSFLVEALPISETGLVGATLLGRTGDAVSACEALRVATRDEEYAPLAALLWKTQASFEPSFDGKLKALDEAVARCPGLSTVRWARFFARLERGDVAAAIADAEHIEASASDNRARHEICRAAAERILAAGYQRDAGRLFERALRYIPDDPAATAGLARALIEAGRSDRALALLERAITLGDAKNVPQPEALLDLGKLLAKLGDLPQAIARLRQVAAPSASLAEARALEAQLRERLGDLAGASLAYARLREVLDLGPVGDARAASEWLLAAARFEREARQDVVSAERHLASALRLSPRDRSVADAYREVAALVHERAIREDG